ncbi:amylo-alpha-1,6-glucosidase [Cohnella fermenti]
MKVNTLGPEGAHKRFWSTPDRVPHKDMWLWDTVFHSLAMNRLSPLIAWECLASMLDSQRSDGMLPHQVSVQGRRSAITQPPVMAWGIWQNYMHHQQEALLEEALPRLESYLLWNLKHRDLNGNGLLEWDIEGDVNCRSGESGMDNSSRFDEACKLDAVDFNVFMVQDMAAAASICRELGHAEKALVWEQSALKMEKEILETLWDDEDGFFYDRRFDGSFSKVLAVSGFVPLLLDGIREDQIDRLVKWMKDERHFQTQYPLPSLAISEPTWSTDMWRGPVWINLNYLIILGLRKHKRYEEADFLSERTIELVQTYYEQYGVTFEYYDSADGRPPIACDRKGPRQLPYDIRQKYDSIRDYHWTAALTACLLWPASQ